MRLTFVIHAMGAGGAERVMATMANAWSETGHSITILTLEDDARGTFYPLHPAVCLRHLGVASSSVNALQAVLANASRLRVLRRAIMASRPDAVISFVDIANITTLLATTGTGIPVIVEEHTDPSARLIGRPWRILRDRTYRRAAKVVVLSDTARRYFASPIQNNAVVIPNPISIAPGHRPDTAPDRKRLVSLGRLAPEKGFDRLIAAFAAVAADHSDWDLMIFGEGPMRPTLERQRSSTAVPDRIALPGSTTHPHDVLRGADLFALTSHREGFPMALAEAMACGTPVVAIDCPSGPRQLIRHGIDGLLIPDAGPEPLIHALDLLMGDATLRERLGSNAPKVLERYSVERVMAQWDALLAEIAPRALATNVHQFPSKTKREAA